MTFTFTDQEMQLVLNVLVQRPYVEVFELINNIQRQAAQPQLHAVPEQAAS